MSSKLMLDGTFSEPPQSSTPSNNSSFQQMSEANCSRSLCNSSFFDQLAADTYWAVVAQWSRYRIMAGMS
ncbi:hypothetical protein TNCV_2720671 [Trichonephila clavipes]|nr:hypothetical protein TNCV_2720671 [Trichonephila clavipes]